MLTSTSESWEIILENVLFSIQKNSDAFIPRMRREPSMKLLVFLVLLEEKEPLSYEQIQRALLEKKLLKGEVSLNTLRTSIFGLSKMLDKLHHPLALNSLGRRFQLLSRVTLTSFDPLQAEDPVLLITTPPAKKIEELAIELVRKARLPMYAHYYLDWPARSWEIFSHEEIIARASYESEALDRLNISNFLSKPSEAILSVVSLAPGEGIGEIEVLKKLLIQHQQTTIHYMAVDTSRRLLREHASLVAETFSSEIQSGRLVCAAITDDIFDNLQITLGKVRAALKNRGRIAQEHHFIPENSSLLVTYFGNCLGNGHQNQETEIFSMIQGMFPQRPLAFLIGVSVMRETPDEYNRSWDDFFVQTPKHLLETCKLLESSRPIDSQELPEFQLSKQGDNIRCPPVNSEPYTAGYGIRGEAYRFYYRLGYSLTVAPTIKNLSNNMLPNGTLLYLYNIIKYDMPSLMTGITSSGLFRVIYDDKYHQCLQTPYGFREYAVFCAYLD